MAALNYKNLSMFKSVSFVLFLSFVFFSVIALFAAFEIVEPGERGVVIELGAVQDRVLEEGFHFIVPFTQRVKIMDVTVQKYVAGADSASKDLQSVYAEIALNYHLDPLRVNSIYQNFRGTELYSFIDPSIHEAVKAGTAKYTAEELITQRDAVKDTITTEMRTRLEEFGILVDGVSIVTFEFSMAFNQAIETKVTAEQNALAEKNRLEQIKYEAEQTIVKAEAEAEAIRIQAEAIQNQGGAEYVQLQAIYQWNGMLPTYMLNEGAVPFLGLD
jgi:regulator of protease activity HflC (stomatin/prohibitin superfamily)